MAREVAIRSEMIRLGQLLKLAGLADDGAQARAMIATGQVAVNGTPEERRGRQLRPGDRVTFAGQELQITAA
jgi:ribosome-associated protein